MKYSYLLLVFLLSFSQPSFSETYQLSSPDKSVKIEVEITSLLTCSITKNDKTIVEARIQMDVNDNLLGLNPEVKSLKRNTANNVIHPVVPLKFSKIANSYNDLTLSFHKNFSVEFRAFNDGVAYRFITAFKDSVKITDEKLQLYWPQHTLLHLQQTPTFRTAYEEPYSHFPVESWTALDNHSTLPILAETSDGYKVLVSESDLNDYPCMFFKGNGNNMISAEFPEFPIRFGPDAKGKADVTSHADYIAKTNGTRTFPWRYLYMTGNDAQILENTMGNRLASPSLLKDNSWIKPGIATWDYWNGRALYGPNVKFKSGYNQATYKYFIDFASRRGIPYFIMDEGWALDKANPYVGNPNINLQELIDYARKKNVGIILWMPWETVDAHQELFAKYREWGISGMKIDFMKRSDQWMVNFYERTAKQAADNHLLVLFHGAFKPAGLEYKYPNILAYEGVRGMEQMQDCTPANTLYIPFMRNAVGAMDYTPGAMISMQPECYSSKSPESASIGTRAYQMALFTIFETGVQMMADSPTQYDKNEDCTAFITKTPVTWDETKGLCGKIGKYVVVAKRKGKVWYVSAITNDEGRSVTILLNFLQKGKKYTMTAFKDGVNADRNAMDYIKETKYTDADSVMNLNLSRNGGWTASFTPINER